MQLAPDESISRCIVYAKAFLNEIHINKQLFVFSQSGADGASHESAVSRTLAPTDTEVHEIGCDIAVKQNASRGHPAPGQGRRYYCGFRSAFVKDVLIKGDGYEVTLCLDGEDGVPSHVDLALKVEAATRSEKATIKVDAGMALAEAFGPAIEHICDCDIEDVEHPLKKNPDCLKIGLPNMDDYYEK